MPDWLEDALQQAEASAKDGQLPAAVLHQDRRPYPESLVVVRPEAFARGVFKAQTHSVFVSGAVPAVSGRYASSGRRVRMNRMEDGFSGAVLASRAAWIEHRKAVSSSAIPAQR